MNKKALLLCVLLPFSLYAPPKKKSMACLISDHKVKILLATALIGTVAAFVKCGFNISFKFKDFSLRFGYGSPAVCPPLLKTPS